MPAGAKQNKPRRHRGRRGKAPRANSTKPTIGLALIVKDEEENLPRLLESIEGAFDQIVLVDTGSTDNTVSLFTDWCEATGQVQLTDTFEWVDDFSAARNYAYGLLTTGWTCWADADDTIEGAQRLRELAKHAPPELAGFIFDYHYAHNEAGACTLTFPRERLVRRSAGTWVGRAHDAQVIAGAMVHVPGVRWVHHGHEDLDAVEERDRRILENWQQDEPENLLVSAALKAYGVSPEAFDLSVALAHKAEREKAAQRLAASGGSL